jgi:hypothetical protein
VVWHGQFCGYYAAAWPRATAQGRGRASTARRSREAGADTVRRSVPPRGECATYAISGCARCSGSIEQRRPSPVWPSAQIFEGTAVHRSPYQDKGITKCRPQGKKVGSWGYGSGGRGCCPAACRVQGSAPRSGISLVPWAFDARKVSGRSGIDAAQADLAVAGAPRRSAGRGKRSTAGDHGRDPSWNRMKAATMLRDAIWAGCGQLADDTATRSGPSKFIQGLDREAGCVPRQPQKSADIGVAELHLGTSHQLWTWRVPAG